ncbi:MAG: hypothetical protein DWQ34_28295 [Planctomycetota bacterium]|nr:MAG: hypothetical protein DWQ34_28295 [Planctomycetota bacterium]REJ90137.1 MAG: hypothetical protein DWQ29_06960 [Planctomycetota bacterium]REK30717.1 MAG: hypothetical protein DWQ41_01855 [Planctomycetota bacterium]REK33092.1 MAG: hypothetical protein DWQ45_15960 [Planctomycetota bacterium]
MRLRRVVHNARSTRPMGPNEFNDLSEKRSLLHAGRPGRIIPDIRLTGRSDHLSTGWSSGFRRLCRLHRLNHQVGMNSRHDRQNP